MNDDVGAPLEGPAQIGRGEGVIDDQGNAGLIGDDGDGLEVEDDAAGLARPSQKMNFTLSVIALRKFSGSAGSTKWHVQPSFLKLTPNWVIDPP